MKPWMFLVLGVGLFTGGIYKFMSTQDFIGAAVSANGVVIDLQREWNSDDRDYTYYPRVRFGTENGRSYEFTGHVGSGRGTFDVGEPVRVLYDPADPYRARIDSFTQLWFVPLFFSGIGLIFTAMGASSIVGVRPEALESGPSADTASGDAGVKTE